MALQGCNCVSSAMQAASAATEVGAEVLLFPKNPQLCGGVKPDGIAGSVCYPSLLAWRFTTPDSKANITVLNLSPSTLVYVTSEAIHKIYDRAFFSEMDGL